MCRPRNRGLPESAREARFEYFAGMVPMDRARQDWVYEHAETGIPALPSGPQLRKKLPRALEPYAARQLRKHREQLRNRIPPFPRAELRRNRRSNGPAGSITGPTGHISSAIGTLASAARSACSTEIPPWFAAFVAHHRAEAIAPALLRFSATLIIPCLASAFPLSLAVRASRIRGRTER